MSGTNGTSSADRAPSLRMLFAGAIGTSLEFYDLTIYGMMAATLAPLFFPSDNATASLIAAFAAFAVGMVARIAGGLAFGWFSDRFDRQKSLIWSILLMALSCGLLALLPTYEAIGVAAPILLFVLRMIQGLAVGGELGVSYVFVGEHAHPNRRAMAMTSVSMGVVLGTLLGLVVVALLHLALTDTQFMVYGWRIGFGLGVSIALVGFLIRSGPTKPAESNNVSVKIWSQTARSSKRIILNIVALGGIAGSYFGLFIFIPTWAIRTVGVDPQTTHLAIVFGALAVILALPLSGLLTNRIGARPAVWIGSLVLATALYPLLSMFGGADPSAQIAIFAVLGALEAIYIASIAALTFGLYPKAIRGLSFSLVFNTTYGVIGGTTPLIATWLISIADNPLAFVWYLIGLCLVSAISVLYLRPVSSE